MDIRLYTHCIVTRYDKYLQCRNMVTGKLVWSNSPWDAWMTRKLNNAYRVAHRIGGSVMLFNPVSGEKDYLCKRA